MSHNVTVKVEYKNQEALKQAVLTMGGQVLGEGTHRMFEKPVTGFGFKLPNWQYPLVLTESGEMIYDDYHGRWGNTKDLDTLSEWYALSAAQMKAHELGWYSEFNEEAKKLTIFHPDGGTIVVTGSGQVETFGFQGASCAAASAPIESAMGTATAQELKPEYNQLNIQQGHTGD